MTKNNQRNQPPSDPCSSNTGQSGPCSSDTSQEGSCPSDMSQSVSGSSDTSQSGPSGIGVWVPLQEYLASVRTEGVSAVALSMRTRRQIQRHSFLLPTRRTLGKSCQWCYEVWVSDPDTLHKLAWRRKILQFARQYRPQSVQLRIPPQMCRYMGAMLKNELLREFDRMITAVPITDFKTVGYSSAQAESGPAKRKRIRLTPDAWQKIRSIEATYRMSVSTVVASLLVRYYEGKHMRLPCVLRDDADKHLAA